MFPKPHRRNRDIVRCSLQIAGYFDIEIQKFKDLGLSVNKTYNITVIAFMDSSEAQGNCTCPKDEDVQNQAAGVFLGVHRFAHVEGLQGCIRVVSMGCQSGI